MDTAEQSLLVASVNAALSRVRPGADDPVAVDALLAEVGWLELLAAEPDVALEVVFGALGATGAAATVLDDVLAAALGMEPSARLAVLLPSFATWDAPGRIEGGRVVARGLATVRAAGAALDGELLVVSRADADGAACVAVVSTARVELQPVRGIDPDACLQSVRVMADASRTTPLDAEAWQGAVARGRRAVAQQTAGACRAMLALAVAHARDRVQFGRAIARFQAVRHRLAEALVAIESLDAALAVAAEDRGADTAALAKAVAGRTARTVRAHCQQVLAGIGFTTEHAFHRFYKRTMLLDGLLGTADDVVLALGRQLLAARKVPTLIEL
jgi:hypothetical protein